MLTPDKDPQVQEAESRKYSAPIVIPLSSGGFAVCLPDRQLFSLADSPIALALVIRDAMAEWDRGKAERQRKPPVRSTADLDSILADLKL